jgi:hypothetical protein
MGRRSKLPFIDLSIVKSMAEAGMTDVQMCKAFKVSRESWRKWKLTNKRFLATLKRAKKLSDDEVVHSLYRRATGFKDHPPDTTACIYWLNNRRPKEWRNRKEVNLGGQYNNPDSVPVETKQEVTVVDNRKSIKDLPIELQEAIEKELEKNAG